MHKNHLCKFFEYNMFRLKLYEAICQVLFRHQVFIDLSYCEFVSYLALYNTQNDYTATVKCIKTKMDSNITSVYIIVNWLVNILDTKKA